MERSSITNSYILNIQDETMDFASKMFLEQQKNSSYYNTVYDILKDYNVQSFGNMRILQDRIEKQDIQEFYQTKLMNIDRLSKNKYSKVYVDNLNIVGIDRIKLYIDVIAVDFENFEGKIEKDVTGNNNNKNEIIDINTGEVKAISSFYYKKELEINNSNIIKYRINLKRNRYGPNIKRFILDITAPVALYNDFNLRNVKMQDIRIILGNIKKELKDRSIDIGYENSEFTYIEINKNVLAKEYLYKNIKMFRLLRDIVFNDDNNSKEKANINDKDINSLTFKFSHSKRTNVIYDKSAHLKNKYNVNIGGDVYRYEIKLDSVEAVRRALGSNKLDVLNRNINLQDVFNKYIQNDFIKGIEDKLNIHLLELQQLITKSNLKCVKEVYYKNQDMIFDINIFALAMFNRYKVLGNSTNFAKDLRKLIISDMDLYKSKSNNLIELEALISLIIGKEIKIIKIPPNIYNNMAKLKKKSA